VGGIFKPIEVVIVARAILGVVFGGAGDAIPWVVVESMCVSIIAKKNVVAGAYARKGEGPMVPFDFVRHHGIANPLRYQLLAGTVLTEQDLGCMTYSWYLRISKHIVAIGDSLPFVGP
jgi:hypothetical protein